MPTRQSCSPQHQQQRQPSRSLHSSSLNQRSGTHSEHSESPLKGSPHRPPTRISCRCNDPTEGVILDRGPSRSRHFHICTIQTTNTAKWQCLTTNLNPYLLANRSNCLFPNSERVVQGPESSRSRQATPGSFYTNEELLLDCTPTPKSSLESQSTQDCLVQSCHPKPLNSVIFRPCSKVTSQGLTKSWF